MDTHRSLPSLGIPELDSEHQDIIETILKFRVAIAEDKNWIELYSIMEDIERKAQTHFRVEENLMQIHGYPNLGKHAEEHGEYSYLLQTVRTRLVRVTPGTVTADFILDWWYQHIPESDQGYADWFSKIDSQLIDPSQRQKSEFDSGSGI